MVRQACPEDVSHFDRLSVTRIEGLTMTGVTLSSSKGGFRVPDCIGTGKPGMTTMKL